MKKLKYKLIDGKLYFKEGYRNRPSDWGRSYSNLISNRVYELRNLHINKDIRYIQPNGLQGVTYFYVSIGDKTW